MKNLSAANLTYLIDVNSQFEKFVIEQFQTTERRRARQLPTSTKKPGTTMSAQMILSKCCFTQGRLPKK